MKLSELIAFRNRLEELPVSAAEQAANHKLDILMYTVTHPLNSSMLQLTQPVTSILEDKLNKIHDSFNNFNLVIEQLKQQVRDQIAEQEKHWFQESYRVFEQAEDCEKTPQILDGRKVIGTMSGRSILHARKGTGAKSEQTIESENTLRARLSTYANWRWPGMIIRPGLEDFIENMVGSDPLYIIDREHDLLQPSLERFPLAYQNRLRSYTTNDWSNQPILGKIPNNQFGVCLAYNVFNYRPLEIIRRYLEEIYIKLRPGGVLLMTYNDCDLAHAVMLVEQSFASYTPGYLIRDLTQNVGFELIHTWSDGGPSVWLELHKPGQLLSNRGGQALAKIYNVFDYSDDIDFLKRKVYTKDEVAKLQDHANSLGISKKIIKRSKNYDLQVLITDTIERKKEEERIKKWQEVAVKNNIELSLPDWQDLVEKIFIKEAEEQRIIQEQQYLQHLKEIAILHNVNINSADWKKNIEEILRKRADEEQCRIEKEQLEQLQQLAKKHNVDMSAVNWKNTLHEIIHAAEVEEERIARELHEELAKSIDQRKKEELARLRHRAMELQVGNPNLIRYGYSAEKLKNLIKQKEEENK